MDADNLDRLLKQYITHLRMKSSENKIFSNHNKLNNGELLRKLGIESTGNHIANCERIIRKLIKDYNYFGEYTLGTINAFLSRYEGAQKESIHDIYELQLLQNEYPPNDIVRQILAELHRTMFYYATESVIKSFKTKSHKARLEKIALEYVQQQNKNQQQRLLQEQEQQLLQTDNVKNNIAYDEVLQNDFLHNKEMEAEPFPKFNFANGLENLRRQSTARLANINPVDLETLRTAMRTRQHNTNLQPRSKKNKLGITGMDDLINVVVKLKNDVKQIREAQSVESAQDWIQRRGYENLYDVVEEDLDNDGYPEVVVKDKLGKNVIVNGYTTEPSLFPYRKYYYAHNPTKESRKHNPWRSYIKNELYKPTYDETGREMTGITEEGAKFDENIGDHGYSKHLTPKSRSSYQVFTERCISPFYKALKYLNFGTIPFKLAQLSGYIWKLIVLNPVLTHIYGNDVLTAVTERKELAKICRQREVKDAIESIVVPYITNSKGMYADILPIVINKWREMGFTMNIEQTKDFVLATRALVASQQLPPRVQFDAWKQNVLATDEEAANFVNGITQYVQSLH